MHANTTSNCVVRVNNISKNYDGQCKNGYAHGEGVAVGKDSYEGEFKAGYPDGYGIYVSKDGTEYHGYWERGKKHGEGKLIETVDGEEIVTSGYWENGKYIGEEEKSEPYRVNLVRGIVDYKVKEVESSQNKNDKVQITIKKLFADVVPQDLNIRASTGQVYRRGRKLAVAQHAYPLILDIEYTINIGMQQKDCAFSITIVEEGHYAITLMNH